MQQRKLTSALEVSLNTASGFVISLCIWQVLGTWLGYDITFGTNLFITSVFTVASLLRSYFWRRYFTNIGDRLYERFIA